MLRFNSPSCFSRSSEELYCLQSEAEEEDCYLWPHICYCTVHIGLIVFIFAADTDMWFESRSRCWRSFMFFCVVLWS